MGFLCIIVIISNEQKEKKTSKKEKTIIKARKGLPVYYRYHIKKGFALGKGLKIGRYQDFTKKRNQVADVLQACCRRVSIRVRYQDFTKKRNQSQKRKEKKRNEIKKKAEDEEDELVNRFNDTMNISKRRRVDDV
jgi:hypothetical protein